MYSKGIKYNFFRIFRVFFDFSQHRETYFWDNPRTIPTIVQVKFKEKIENQDHIKNFINKKIDAARDRT